LNLFTAGDYAAAGTNLDKAIKNLTESLEKKG
jgi:hypothetical protein